MIENKTVMLCVYTCRKIYIITTFTLTFTFFSSKLFISINEKKRTLKKTHLQGPNSIPIITFKD